MRFSDFDHDPEPPPVRWRFWLGLAAVAALAVNAFVFLNATPLRGGTETGWPWVSYRVVREPDNDEAKYRGWLHAANFRSTARSSTWEHGEVVEEERYPTSYPIAFGANVVAWALLLASLPGLRMLEAFSDRGVFSLRDLFCVMGGAAVFFAAVPRGTTGADWITALPAAATFVSATVCVLWGVKRLSQRDSAARR